MMKIVIFSMLCAGIAAITNPPITGETPPPVDCPNSLCSGRPDGNYEYKRYRYGSVKKNYFVQCIGGNAYCQACWPLTMKFSERCNQCLYNVHDPCYTTQSWVPEKRFNCPDICPRRGPSFQGNIADPYQKGHYVGCWNGVTMGCVNCPAGLLFNEYENACLYEGKYLTKPMKDKYGSH